MNNLFRITKDNVSDVFVEYTKNKHINKNNNINKTENNNINKTENNLKKNT